ncbi:MAG: F420-0:Gamma-glutamyl ligase [Firmicutes bacterium]|nr:F420-0:Gamma-glutamyl ligase [Bacillota bacterium]
MNRIKYLANSRNSNPREVVKTAGKIAIRTHLLKPGDNIVEVVERYIKNIGSPGDLIAICESVVAITQGRIFLPSEVRAGILASFLCRFTGRHGSLTSPAAMQLAVNEVGRFRILWGAALGALGKLMGKKGLFYHIAGRQAALIDDVAGTMPPFERHIILGPRDAQGLARAIWERTGIDTVIVDVNNLRCVDIIGASRGIDQRLVVTLLEDNPSGNYDEQTPITLIKNYRERRW